MITTLVVMEVVTGVTMVEVTGVVMEEVKEVMKVVMEVVMGTEVVTMEKVVIEIGETVIVGDRRMSVQDIVEVSLEYVEEVVLGEDSQGEGVIIREAVGASYGEKKAIMVILLVLMQGSL